MAFGKMTKEDFKEAGFDIDDFMGKLGGAVTKAELTAVEQKFDGGINSIKDMITALETKMTTTSVSRSSSEGNNEGNNNSGNNSGERNNDNGNKNKTVFDDIDPIEFATDPASGLRKVATAVAMDGRIQNMNFMRTLAYRNATATLDGFKNETIKSEIDEEWKRYTPQLLVQMGSDPEIVIKKVHDSIMGAHFTEIQRDTAKKEGKFNLIQGGGTSRVESTNLNTNRGTNDGERTAANNFGLDANELAMAKRYGMTPEEWYKEQTAMVSEGRAMII